MTTAPRTTNTAGGDKHQLQLESNFRTIPRNRITHSPPKAHIYQLARSYELVPRKPWHHLAVTMPARNTWPEVGIGPQNVLEHALQLCSDINKLRAYKNDSTVSGSKNVIVYRFEDSIKRGCRANCREIHIVGSRAIPRVNPNKGANEQRKEP
jgi:hypothetical protein